MQYRNALLALAALTFGAAAAHAQQPQTSKAQVPAAKHAATTATTRAQQPAAKTTAPTATKAAADTGKNQMKVAAKPTAKPARRVSTSHKRSATHASAAKAKHDSTAANPAKKAP